MKTSGWGTVYIQNKNNNISNQFIDSLHVIKSKKIKILDRIFSAKKCLITFLLKFGISVIFFSH